jgi:hypothetical protein
VGSSKQHWAQGTSHWRRCYTEECESCGGSRAEPANPKEGTFWGSAQAEPGGLGVGTTSTCPPKVDPLPGFFHETQVQVDSTGAFV